MPYHSWRGRRQLHRTWQRGDASKTRQPLIEGDGSVLARTGGTPDPRFDLLVGRFLPGRKAPMKGRCSDAQKTPGPVSSVGMNLAPSSRYHSRGARIEAFGTSGGR